MWNFPIAAWIENFSQLPGARRLFSHPSQYHVLTEPPVGADSKARNLALPDQLVNRGLVKSEQVANVFYRQDFLIARHRDLRNTFLFKIARKASLHERNSHADFGLDDLLTEKALAGDLTHGVRKAR
jgi:hypothetical protein